MISRQTKCPSKLVNYVPGSVDGQLLLAKTKFLSRDFEASQGIINRCLQLNPALSDAHLLSANIAFLQEDYTGAINNLERALSFDFSVKERFSYNLLRAQVNAATGDLGEALEMLQYAMRSVDQEKYGEFYP